MEVAIQCLETAFGVTVEDSDLALPQTLSEIFEAAASGKEVPQDLRSPQQTPPSEEDSAEAERLKTEGNEQMKVENFEAAVHFYGKAIELNPPMPSTSVTELQPTANWATTQAPYRTVSEPSA